MSLHDLNNERNEARAYLQRIARAAPTLTELQATALDMYGRGFLDLSEHEQTEVLVKVHEDHHP